jgi:hypothetical protein
MGKVEIENFSLREIKSSLKRFFSPDFTCKAILLKQIAMGSIVEKQQG